MKKHLSLAIETPCSEKWDTFTPTSTGGFCGSCSKNVIDFTHMSDAEIRDFFSKRPEHTCGRFRPDQLKIYSFPTTTIGKSSWRLFYAGILSLFVLVSKQGFAQQSTKAQTRSEIAQLPVSHHDAQALGVTSEFIIRGVVKLEDTEELLAAVSVYLKGTTEGTVTDEKGKFEFPRKLKEGDVLVFSALGYEDKEYTITKDSKSVIDITMKLSHMQLMGEVVANDVYAPHQSGIQKLWNKIKGLF